MVHKNYKWNISEEKGRIMISDLIVKVLKETKDNIIDIDELLFILNNRTKTVTITNNKKDKTLTNYIKVVFGGIINFIDGDDKLLLEKKDSTTLLKLTDIGMTDWIFVDDYE